MHLLGTRKWRATSAQLANHTPALVARNHPFETLNLHPNIEGSNATLPLPSLIPKEMVSELSGFG
jgi:hypothetical protein